MTINNDTVRGVVAVVVGVVVGYFTESPQLGFAAASLVYGATAPNVKREGPRLTDLKAPGATYGTPIPYLEGTPRVAGIYIWYSDKRAIAKETTSEKGSQGVDTTLYTYQMDALIELSINILAGIRRIWSNGKLIWTAAADADDESLLASTNTTAWRAIRFYSGDPAQMPDPVYEVAVGVGYAPAYRDRATVFIEGLNLGQSGQLPVLTFEVVSEGTVAASTGLYEPFNYSLQAELSANYGGSVDPAIFRITGGYEGGTGGALQAVGGVVSAVTTTITRNITVVDFTQISFYVRVDDFSPGNPFPTAPEDGPLFVVTGPYVDDIFVFDSAREKVFDTTQSAYAKVLGAVEGFVSVTPDKLVAGVWYKGVLHQNSTIECVLTITDLSTGLVYQSTTFTGTFAPWTASSMSFVDNGSAGSTDVKPEATYDEVVIGAPGERITPTDVHLDQVVKRLSLRTGLLTEDDFDVTELEDDIVHGFAVTQVSPTRQAIETLMAGFLFEAVEGEKIKFVKRGGASVITIPYEDMGASSGDPVEPLPVQRRNDIELPARVTIKYPNILNDYQDGSESGDRIVTDSTAVTVVELPIGFTPTEAKRVADVQTTDLAISIVGIGPVSLARKYPQLEPTDVVTLTAKDGSTFRARIQKATAAQGINTFEFVLDDASVINSVANTSGNYASSSLVREVSPTTDVLLDTAIFRDADNDSGFYVLAKPVGTKWAGTIIFSSRDDVSYTQEVGITSRAIFGTCSTILGDWTGARVFDEMNSVTVNVGVGELSSSTRDDMIADESVGACAIGIDGKWELLQYRDATLISPGVYTLTGFLRGSRGTEWAMTDHVAAETFCLIQAAGLARISTETSLLGIERFYKAVSVGRNLATTSSQPFTNFGIGLKPFSPFDARATRDPGSGEITLTWQRRTRFSMIATGPMAVSLPIGEITEAYAVDVFSDNTYTTVVRTLTSSVAFVNYSAADQTSDFGSPQSTIYFRIYQLSQAVGRGYPLQAAA